MNTDDLVKRIEKLDSIIDRLYDKLHEANTRIAELEAALNFYRDDANWRRNGLLDANSANFTGGPARAALEKNNA